jgi:hypothetical protein
LAQHEGSHAIELVDDYVQLALGSGLRPEDIATPCSGLQWQLQATGLQSAQLWRKVYGARLGIRPGCTKDRAIQKLAKGKPHIQNYRSVQKGVLKAAGVVSTTTPNIQRGPSGQAAFSLRGVFLQPATGGLGCGTATNKYWNNRFHPNQFAIGIRWKVLWMYMI